MRKQVLLAIVCCVTVAIGLAAPAPASLINVEIGGDTVVYDNVNNLYWYPVLTDFIGMTLNEQLAKIDNMTYGGRNDWRMASWTETSLLKLSMMGMATKGIVPTEFGPGVFGTPVLNNRTVSSPMLAWDVNSADFFTPTGTFNLAMVGIAGYEDGDVFNGRTNGWGMTNNGDGGFFGEVVEGVLPADDHWVSVSYMNEGDDNLTFLGNFDQHLRYPEETWNPVMGNVGAWVVSGCSPDIDYTQIFNSAAELGGFSWPVPEPNTMLLFGSGIAGLAMIGRRRKE